jgi:hypothetical protein
MISTQAVTTLAAVSLLDIFSSASRRIASS